MTSASFSASRIILLARFLNACVTAIHVTSPPNKKADIPITISIISTIKHIKKNALLSWNYKRRQPNTGQPAQEKNAGQLQKKQILFLCQQLLQLLVQQTNCINQGCSILTFFTFQCLNNKL